MRIDDAVENKDKRRRAGRIDGVERVVERMAVRERLDARDDALMALTPGQPTQARVVALDNELTSSARATSWRMRWSRRPKST